MSRYRSSLLCILTLAACRGQVGTLDENIRGAAVRGGATLKGHVATSGSKKRFTTFRYDLLGRAVTLQHTLEGQTYEYGYEFSYAGGAARNTELGNLPTALVFPDHEVLRTHFDAAGNPQRITAQSSPSTSTDVLRVKSQRNVFGQVSWTEAGNSTRTFHLYNTARQLSHTLTQRVTDGKILQAFGYTYDKVGRVTQVRDYCSPTPQGVICCDPRSASCSEGPQSARYDYDVAGWLRQMTTASVTQNFSVDALGNLVKKDHALQMFGEQGLPHAVTQVKNEQGALLSRYRYSPVGNMDSMEEDGVRTTLFWNALNMPVKTIQANQITERFYLGETLYKRLDTQEGKTQTTLFLPNLRIEDGVFRKSLLGFAERETHPSEPSRNTLRFFHRDHLGSSTLVTDAQGTPLTQAAYFPFGETRFSEGSFTPKEQFTSKEKEPLSGLYDFGARLYNPRTGTFVSADSVMDGLNAYAYVRNNPLNWVDPSGHTATCPNCVDVGPIDTIDIYATVEKTSKSSWWKRAVSKVKDVASKVSAFFTPGDGQSHPNFSAGTSFRQTLLSEGQSRFSAAKEALQNPAVAVVELPVNLAHALSSTAASIFDGTYCKDCDALQDLTPGEVGYLAAHGLWTVADSLLLKNASASLVTKGASGSILFEQSRDAARAGATSLTADQANQLLQEKIFPGGQLIGERGGRSYSVRILEGNEYDALQFFMEFENAGNSINAVQTELPNGYRVQFREKSKSGPPTVDIIPPRYANRHMPGLTHHMEIKFQNIH